MKLYIYDHCPYCVKARMIFGLKHIPVTLITLLNDDEETPLRMIGRKMVPILQKDDGSVMPESMDIVHYIDRSFGTPLVQHYPPQPELETWKESIRIPLYSLAMPRWVKVGLEEFATPKAVHYFTLKKEQMIGDFANNIIRTPELTKQVNALLLSLPSFLSSSSTVHDNLSEEDFHVFALLRALSVVKGITYPEKVDAYRQKMAKASGVPLHDAIAV